ncbi:MAG: hypothetical protein H6828_14005 [Planctomycetes bacterium]|nr:hypothetical protein [Planctomycetota bacterium]
MLVAALLALAPCSAQDPLAEVPVVETKHYELHLSMDAARRADWAVLVETAWKLYAQELGGKPKSRPGEKLVVRFYETRDDWLRGMEREEEFPLPGVNFVHHAPARDTVFLHGEPDLYHARKMLLYGLFLQFHHGLKAKNQYLGGEWFLTGMADALSTHTWDGEHLVLGARRLLTTENRASLALYRNVLQRISDRVLSIEDMSDWDVRWALTAYLLWGDDGRYRDVFQRLALGKKGSMLLGTDFLAGIGDVAEITAGMEAWVVRNAAAFEPQYGLWAQHGSDLDARRVDGETLAIALGSASWTHVAADAPFLEDVEPGLVLDWTSPRDCTLALHAQGSLRVLHLERGKAETLGSFWLGEGPHRLAATLRDGRAVLAADGDEIGGYDCPSSRVGLVVRNGDARFGQVVGE